jgi:hypothetical protein
MPVGPDGGLLVNAAWFLDVKLTSLPLLHLAKAIGCAVAASCGIEKALIIVSA